MLLDTIQPLEAD